MARESFEDARIAELLNRYFVSIKVDREERPDVDSIYDPVHGGFGLAPKFPTPHIILFLLACYERRGDAECLKMARHSLEQMYRGGLYNHIGFGFCRYSTDERFLVPHFEKMLYDNALMILAYSCA